MQSNIKIGKITLNNYRNHKFLKLCPKNEIIIINGQNGSGKTNILESISLFDTPNGFRNAKLNDLIRTSMNGPHELFGVNIDIAKGIKTNKVGVGIKKKDELYKKIISVDGEKTTGNYVRELISIFWIIPKMSYLFQANSDERRSFLDMMISSFDKMHKKRINYYEKYKSERLQILKNWNNRQTEWLDIIEEKMASTGIILCDSRRSFLKLIEQNYEKIHRDVGSLSFKLTGFLDEKLSNCPALEVEETFVKILKTNRDKDKVSGRTNISANKTDLSIYEKVSGNDVRNFSTGEQKVLVVSLILSYLKILEKFKVKKVIFLLDDIFSYLDKTYIKLILDKILSLRIQTWITDVRTDWIKDENNFFSKIDIINIDD